MSPSGALLWVGLGTAALGAILASATAAARDASTRRRMAASLGGLHRGRGPRSWWWGRPPRRRCSRAGRRAQRDRELVALCRHLTTTMRAGTPLRVALAEAALAGDGAVASALSAALSRHRAGTPLRVALLDWAAAVGGDAAPVLATAVLVGATSGGSTAAALDAVAVAIGDRLDAAADRRAAASQARASAWVVGGMAPAAAVVVAAVDPGVVRVLTTTPLGWSCAAATAVLEVVGWWWMRVLVGAER